MPSSAAASAPASASASAPSSPASPRPTRAPIFEPSSIASSCVRLLRLRDLDLAVRVLVHGQSVDDPDGVARAQPLQLLDDLAVELGVVEPEDDQLNWSNGHA